MPVEILICACIFVYGLTSHPVLKLIIEIYKTFKDNTIPQSVWQNCLKVCNAIPSLELNIRDVVRKCSSATQTTSNAVQMIGFHFMLHSVAMAMMALILYAHSKVAISIWI